MHFAVLVPVATSVPDVGATTPRQEKKTSHKWNPRNFKEKMKAKFQSKVRVYISYENINTYLKELRLA